MVLVKHAVRVSEWIHKGSYVHGRTSLEEVWCYDDSAMIGGDDQDGISWEGIFEGISN